MEQTFNFNQQGENLVIRNGKAPDIFEYKGFKHRAYSTESFTRLVKAKANKPNCVIAYDKNGMTAILDDSVVEREQDRVVYGFKNSLQFEEWKRILNGCTMSQKELIKFLQRRESGEVEVLEILMYSLQNFKYVTNIEGDFTQQDSHNYTFAIKTKEGEGTVKIPQIIEVNLEIFNESGFTQKVEVELEVYKPKDPSEAPGFRLECPKLQRYEKQAIDNEIDVLKQELEEFLIVTGSI